MILYESIIYYITVYNLALYYIILDDIMAYYIISFYIISYYIILYYIILYYIILYCIILYYIYRKFYARNGNKIFSKMFKCYKKTFPQMTVRIKHNSNVKASNQSSTVGMLKSVNENVFLPDIRGNI